MKIALIFPPLYGVDMPPLGIAYIAAKLIEDGHHVKVFCLNSQLYNENEDKRYLWDWNRSEEWSSLERIGRFFDVQAITEKWVNEILNFNPAMVGFSVNSHSRILADLLADKLKANLTNLPVIFGGPWCTELSNVGELNKNVDIYVRGEGEGIISGIASFIASGRSIFDLNIKGTIVKVSAGFRDNGINNEILDINNIPFPALQLFDFKNYTNKEEIPIIFSRGCSHYCRFCTDKPMWGSYRMRSSDNISLEMAKHGEIFKRKKFKCNDLMINGDLSRLNEFADTAIEKKLHFQWGSMARARPDMDKELFDKIKKAGCVYLTYGIESGAHKVLRHMGKPDKKTISKALKLTHSSGIKVNTLWMVGYPVEGWFEFFETLLFLFTNRRNIDEFVSASACYIPRRSLLYKQGKLLGIEYDDRAQWHINFKNTAFIRDLRRRILLFFAKFIKLYREGIK